MKIENQSPQGNAENSGGQARPPMRRSAWQRFNAAAQRHPAVMLAGLLLIGVLIIRSRALVRDIQNQFGPPRPQLPWRHNISRAAAVSAKTGRPLLVDFNAPWCPPCRAMRRNVWVSRRVQAYVKQHFIPVSADISAPAGQRLARQYAVDSIPRVLVLNAKGRIVLSASDMGVASTLRFLRAAAHAPPAGRLPRDFLMD